MASVTEDLSQRLRALELGNQRNADRILSHEEICAERYANINSSMRGMLRALLWFGGALLLGMAGILTRLVFFPPAG